MSRRNSKIDLRPIDLMARVMLIYIQRTERKQPRPKDLMHRFGMSRATAYRYMAAARDALGWNAPGRCQQ